MSIYTEFDRYSSPEISIAVKILNFLKLPVLAVIYSKYSAVNWLNHFLFVLTSCKFTTNCVLFNSIVTRYEAEFDEK